MRNGPAPALGISKRNSNTIADELAKHGAHCCSRRDSVNFSFIHSRCSITEQTLSASSILQYIRKVANNPDQWNFCSRVHLVIALCLIEWVAADVVQCEGKVCISIFPRLLQKCTSLHHPNVCRFPDDHSLARTGSRPVVASQQAENLSAVTRKAFRSCRHEDSLCTWLRAHCTGHVQTR